MLIHNVYFWLRKNLSPQEMATFRHELILLSKISYLEKGYVGGPGSTEKRAVVDQSFDFATSFLFKNLDDHEYYQTKCPDHARFVSSCKSYWDKVVVYDLSPLS